MPGTNKCSTNVGSSSTHTHTLHVHVFVDTEFSPRDLGDQREEREKSSYKLKLSIIYCPEDLDTGKINK